MRRLAVRRRYLARMQRRTRLIALMALIAGCSVSACSGGDETAASAPVDEAMDIAGDALTESGATLLGAVGGDSRTESTASTTLPAGGTLITFAACTGGGTIELDLGDITEVLDCDGQAHQLDDLVVPEHGRPVFGVTEPADVASTWGIAFAER
ncbi:hypothetical protein [uncultured Modestobacter sp.]|uniref:hypothetical protein n=1 Tax=uncultured Modestobacter sp. TaxID=380048 RepID=UPI0026128FB3|nr:hypothetical protein [uncultured Modestobacter sp.]